MGKVKSVLAFTGIPFAWEIHSRYHEMINKIIDKGRAGWSLTNCPTPVAQPEALSQQLVGGMGRIQSILRCYINCKLS
ncbi:Uncharacterised protein [Salmonella enterica subsp. salamae serovar Greenside]|nr:Uncharacterised protein [Salmonella enterica subsp. salamae serovar Greenside]